MNNELATIKSLNGFIESAPAYETLVTFNKSLGEMEKASGVGRAKVLICAKRLYADKFHEFYKMAGYDKTYASKICKTENVIRMIELWDKLNVFEFSIAQLIEFARIPEDRFAELLTNDEIHAELTIREIKALAKEITDSESDSAETDSESDSAETDSESETTNTINVDIDTLYKIMKSNDIVEIHKIVGHILSK